MNIGGRYKPVAKKKHAVVDMPYGEVMEVFENTLCTADGSSRLVGSVCGDGMFKIEYRVALGKKEVYETYCMLVEVNEQPDGTTKIEYAYVYDRLMSWYTKILSIICFAVPCAAAALVFFKFQLRTLPYLAVYIPLLLIAAFGLFSLFGYKEKKQDIKPMVKEFEELLMSAFSD